MTLDELSKKIKSLPEDQGVITRPSSMGHNPFTPYTPFSFTFCDHLFVRKDVYWQACEKCGTLKPIAP